MGLNYVAMQYTMTPRKGISSPVSARLHRKQQRNHRRTEVSTTRHDIRDLAGAGCKTFLYACYWLTASSVEHATLCSANINVEGLGSTPQLPPGYWVTRQKLSTMASTLFSF